MQAEEILARQQTYFQSGATRSLDFREHQLQTLKKMLHEHEEELFGALKKDFGKPVFETYGTELGQVHDEINRALSNLRSWAKKERAKGSLVSFPSTNYIIPEPYGSVLIIGPWNYPVMLLLVPLVGAIAAGNTAVLKPSELTRNTSAALHRMFSKWFKREYISVEEGGVEPTKVLLDQNFDYIFFTGSTEVGKIVMKAAAENLTPVTLELGGKSPCIIEESADLEVAAKRITWGKFMNAGQTCVAPDYVLVGKKYQDVLIDKMKENLREFYGEDIIKSPDYARIIDEKHFDRLISYLEGEEVAAGGHYERESRYLEPTILKDPGPDSAVMQEEIFGPILPVIGVEDVHEAIDIVKSRSKPLALYLFTEKEEVEELVLDQCSFGGGSINDVVVHFGNYNIPIGGVGQSGMGRYHGKYSFDTFSHHKSVMKKPVWPDIPIRYPSYKGKLKWIKKILK